MMMKLWNHTQCSRGTKPIDGLRKYLKSLRLTPDEVTANKGALGKVAHVCHHKITSKFHVDRVITCGSVGKKTAGRNSADLDLAIYFDGLHPQEMKQHFPTILDSIRQAMDDQHPNTRDTERFRKFGLRYNIKGLQIDILIGTKNIMPRHFLQVSDPEQRAYMSASVSHLSKRFMKNQPLLFHDMVRVAKDWRDSFTWAPQCKPKSYLLEVIMLESFRKLNYCTKSKGQINYYLSNWNQATSILLNFFQLLGSVENYHNTQNYNKHNLPSLFICFNTYYDSAELPLDEPEPIFERRVGSGKNVKIKTRKATAIVMDPVNPTNNLWLTLDDASTLVERARKAAEELL